MEDTMKMAEFSRELKSQIKQKLEESKRVIIEDLKKSIDATFNSILEDEVDSKEKEIHVENKTIARRPNRRLPSKVFVAQNSVLTELWSISHISSSYNICTAFFILLLINATLLYIADSKRYAEDIEFLVWIMKDAGVWVSLWLAMKFSSLLIFFPLFRSWTIVRGHSTKIGYIDFIFAFIYFIYISLLVYLPALKLLNSDLSPVTSFFILVEQTRIAFKVYAFARENIPKVIKYKHHQDDKLGSDGPCPEFSKFLYFLFAPTIVYRDEYPRTNKIRWEYVVWNFIQVISTIILTFIAFRRFVVEIFQTVGQEPFSPSSFVLTLTGAIMVGGMSMFAGFYGLLHCWMNAFAEMLTFADRIFYKDWWNCTSFGKYYKTWNTVIHDWLYAYVYRDLHVLFGYRQVPAMFGVFLISAIIHEYILALTMKFFYPVLFFMFVVFGVSVVFITRKKTTAVWNIFLWFSLFLGWALLIVLYSIEWYSRKNCPNVVGIILNITGLFQQSTLKYELRKV